ncbi:MAG: protease complex subunit PrcB family protein [Acidobacteriota bacterium]|nr:protease complex subunit PrcB family protein [Acidobacteriota bacterium]
MKIFKLLLLVVVSFSFISCASAQTNKRKTTKNSNPKATKPMNNKSNTKPTDGNIKVIAEGAYGTIETPFVFVARSKETYAQLQMLVENLPPAAEINFSKMAVIAAFAGTKNTGGYSVSIRQTMNKIMVEVIEPPKDAMTTDALTMPFQVALVPIEEEKSLPLEVSANWKSAEQTYKITSGEFESSGGFAGMLKKFSAEGTIAILSFGNYATLIFNLSGKGANRNMQLTETASGVMKEGKITLARLDAGSFSEGPKPPLKVSGMLAGGKLSLIFEPLPTNVADGFQASGKIEAAKIK